MAPEGLREDLLKAIKQKGWNFPTPVQRRAIPLIMDRHDVVGTSCTGAGKTGAFVIPMLDRLRQHSMKMGARALVFAPSRELAMQTYKAVKDLGKGTDLRTLLLVGGDSMETQFSYMMNNPDIIIATPGRFLHLKVEMSLNLSSVEYVVFDEADRLFEQGFQSQLEEVLLTLPESKQTLLFSATLPRSLAEFAGAGLHDPIHVRFEEKISPDLESVFFSVLDGEKDATLLHILEDLLEIPTGVPETAAQSDHGSSKKRKRGPDAPDHGKEQPTDHSTMIFTATKHHVEYIVALLRHAGYAPSYVYSSLDQTFRRMQIEDFARGRSHIFVVTDLAARGIDIPDLANVIIYDWPATVKNFIHRVGRTARNGRKVWSYSLVEAQDAPYVVDLQQFLGRELVVGRQGPKVEKFTDDIVLGAVNRDRVSDHLEWVKKAHKEKDDIDLLRTVAGKAEGRYQKERPRATKEGFIKAKEVVKSKHWRELHYIYGDQSVDEKARDEMLAKLSSLKPKSIFETRRKDKGKWAEIADMMKETQEKIGRKRALAQSTKVGSEEDGQGTPIILALESGEDDDSQTGLEPDEVTVSNTKKRGAGDDTPWRDSEYYMSYTPRNINTADERAYSVHSGALSSSFSESARYATTSLMDDEVGKSFGAPSRAKFRWDKKQKKYVSTANDEAGAKMIRGESGVKIPASFKSGRFDKWRRANRMGSVPRVGEMEKAGSGKQAARSFRYKLNKQQAPKEADKFRDDYHVRKKRVVV